MGIFDDFNIDIDAVKESSFDIEDGTYRFEIGTAEQLDGTNNSPDTTFFIIDFQLEDEDGEAAGQKRNFYTLAEDGDTETKRVLQSLSFFKADLRALGVTNLADFDGSELVGKTGTLRLVSTPGKGANKGKTYQNIKSITLDEEEAPAPKKAPAKRAASSTAKADAEAKARVKANQAKRAAEAEEDDEDDDENPFG